MSQKVLVAGTGISGISAAKLLLAQGGEVVLYDGNEKLSEEKLKAKFDEGAKVTIVLGELKKTDLMGVELCVITRRYRLRRELPRPHRRSCRDHRRPCHRYPG